VILNNVNKKIIAGEIAAEGQGFSKLVEFKIPKRLLEYMNKLNAPIINPKIKGTNNTKL